MPTTLSIKLDEIIVRPQPRKVFLGIESLAADIRDHSLLQPPTITPSKRLLYGERRYRACKLLGLETINVVVCEEDLTEDEILERQVAENVERNDLSWQESCLAMLELYRMKKRRGALEGWSWGQREASRLFKIELGTVNYVLRVAKKLEEELALPVEKRRYHAFESANEAYRLGLLGEREDALRVELAKRAQVESLKGSSNDLTIEKDRKLITDVRQLTSSPDLLAEERQRYESNPLNKIPFDEYWTEKQRLASESANTIYLSNRIIRGDCVEYMSLEENAGRFDHIITDIPYGIDMSNLSQDNQGMNIDSVVEAHDVDENKALIAKFFPTAFKCTKDSAFVITFCDVMLWQYMHDLAVAAGFAVQRWPIVWRKINQPIMNNCAGFNTTKDFEVIMVCRKKGATVAKKENSSVWEGSNVEATKTTGHPFAKPFEITKRLMDLVSIEGQLILEPFAGRGSIALQMLRMKRNVVAVEKDEAHYNALLENIKTQYYLKLNPHFKFK